MDLTGTVLWKSVTRAHAWTVKGLHTAKSKVYWTHEASFERATNSTQERYRSQVPENPDTDAAGDDH
jgi:hypothetical protein